MLVINELGELKLFFSKDDMDAYMKEAEISPELGVQWIDDSCLALAQIVPCDGYRSYFICFQPKYKEMVKTGEINWQQCKEFFGILAHECTHCAQMFFSSIGEDRPGVESEAYVVQQFFESAIDEYMELVEKWKNETQTEETTLSQPLKQQSESRPKSLFSWIKMRWSTLIGK